jgi:hypothetical protein
MKSSFVFLVPALASVADLVIEKTCDFSYDALLTRFTFTAKR